MFCYCALPGSCSILLWRKEWSSRLWSCVRPYIVIAIVSFLAAGCDEGKSYVPESEFAEAAPPPLETSSDKQAATRLATSATLAHNNALKLQPSLHPHANGFLTPAK